MSTARSISPHSEMYRLVGVIQSGMQISFVGVFKFEWKPGITSSCFISVRFLYRLVCMEKHVEK